MVLAGMWGIYFTYQNVVREQITTPDDASIPNTLVRGPLTLKSQADIIRKHVLETTEGKTFSQMPQKIQKQDADGDLVFDENGKPVMITNDARAIWITATSLMTALNLAIIAYAFSALVIFIGLISIWIGIIFRALKKKYK